MEVTEHISEDDVKVCGMMHLLESGDFESKDRLYQTLEDVYRNFTSIYKAVIAHIDDVRRGFPEVRGYIDLSRQMGVMITFCRCMLKRILKEDGITINLSLVELLTDLEDFFLNIDMSCNNSEWFLFSDIDDLMIMSGASYFEVPSPIYCYQLINYDLIMEFLHQCTRDVFEVSLSYTPTMIGSFTVLRNYPEFLNKEGILGNNLEMLIAVENVAYQLAGFSFVATMQAEKFWLHYEKKVDDILLGLRYEVLQVLVFQSDGFSCSSYPLMTDELLIGYAKCVQDNISKLLRNDTIDLADTLKKVPLMILQGELSFLTNFVIMNQPTHMSEQEKPSDIRSEFQALATNVGSLVYSCFDNSEVENLSLQLLALIEKAGAIRGEVIKTICCMILQTAELESPKQDQLGCLFLLLQNLKDYMDCISGSILTWKDHENLVLFIFYLNQNNIRGGNGIDNDEFSRYTLQLDINHDELDEVLDSAQDVAFNMACSSMLKRYGNLHWWELYLGTKESVALHMRAGILKAIVLSSTTPLTNELRIAYAECVKDNIIELHRDWAFDPLKNQVNILHEGLPFLSRLLINYSDEEEKLSHIKMGFQVLVRSVGSATGSCFSDWFRGGTATNHNTTEIFNLAEKMNLIMVETEKLVYLVHINKVGRESPKTNQVGSLNLLLENWKVLMEGESDLISAWKNEFQMIHEHLILFKSFITSSSTVSEGSRNLCSSITEAVYVAEYLLTTFSVGTCPYQCASLWISEFTKHTELIKAAVMEVNDKKRNVKEISTVGKDQSQISAQAVLVPTPTDLVVGFELEVELIMRRVGGHLKQLDAICIIGMPGLGKTTLARKACEDPYTKSYFDVRAWCSVSQDCNKKELFLTILGSIDHLSSETRQKSESELSVMVHKQLTKRRYFIVLDDVWDINVFMALKRFFPDDNNGSRIMLTSRSKVIGIQVHAQFYSDLVEPCLLTDEQSWGLLERKIYNKGKCPSELCQIGKEIAKKCRGLPLAIVVVGGVLRKGTQTRDSWEKVRGGLSSYLAHDSQSQFMAALELSYRYLPNCLKPMFLYLGAFREDEEIHVDKLTRLWMAEGFVRKTESTFLESEADKILMDLIDRSLVMVAKRRWDGSVKRCRVHDLLSDMCLRKAKEENFMQHVDVHSELPYSVMYQRRLSISLEGNDETTSRHLVAYKDFPKFSITPSIYSLMFSYVGPDDTPLMGPGDLAPVISSLKLLRVFDAEIFNITEDVLEKDLFMLVHLRYLSICSDITTLPSSISRLRSLETLIIKFEYSHIVVPDTIWEMTKLRHLHMYPMFSAPPKNSFILENLETLSTFYFEMEKEDKIIRKVPGLKKLKCMIGCYDLSICQYSDFEFLGELESLQVSFLSYYKTNYTGQFKLPLTLKKLSIGFFCLNWSQISMLKTLPNLEVLKLKRDSVVDEYWDMGEDDDLFTKLRVLKLMYLDIKRWSASSENFPSLEKLELIGCDKLEEIPSSLGEFTTLREIKVVSCSHEAAKTAKQIQKEQEEFGNDSLKFYYYGKFDEIDPDDANLDSEPCVSAGMTQPECVIYGW